MIYSKIEQLACPETYQSQVEDSHKVSYPPELHLNRTPSQTPTKIPTYTSESCTGNVNVYRDGAVIVWFSQYRTL
jgi:hypothetical protein